VKNSLVRIFQSGKLGLGLKQNKQSMSQSSSTRSDFTFKSLPKSFPRFLFDTPLLGHPTKGVSVSLSETFFYFDSQDLVQKMRDEDRRRHFAES